MTCRKGVSSVIGMLLFVLVFMAAFGSLAYMSSLQSRSAQVAQQEQLLVNQHGKESLTYQARSDGTLAIVNEGPSQSSIAYVILKFANGTVCGPGPVGGASVASGTLLSVPSLLPSGNCGSSTWLSKYNTILASTNTGDSVGIVTSLGNVFWERPAQAVQGSTPGSTVQMTFTASGDGAFGSNPVLLVDGMNYTQAQLPVTLTWFVGTKHNYAWQALPQGTGSRVAATITGFAQSLIGTITATAPGAIAATYTAQYLLSVNGGSGVSFSPPSPTNDGWFNAGTIVYVTTNNVWNVVSGQSRANLLSWGVDGATPTSIARAGSGTFTTGGIVMNSPHTLNFNGVTQYQLSLQSSIPVTSGTVPAPAAGYSYITDYSSSQILSNPGFETGSSWPWGGGTGCYYQGPIVTSPVHSGSYALQIELAGWPDCEGASQSVPLSLPAGAVVTSISGSLWYYADASGDTPSFTVAVTSSGNVCESGAQSSISAKTWTQLSSSASCNISQATSAQIIANVNSGCYSLKGVAFYCANWYVDDAILSIAYYVPTSGSLSTTINSYSLSGSTITYTYAVGFNFPSGTVSKSLWVTIPNAETVSQVLVGSGPQTLQPSQYGGGNSFSIPDSTIGSYGGFYTLITTASASSVSQTGSVPSLAVNYQYTVQSTSYNGVTDTTSNSAQMSGTTLTYQYLSSYAFPATSTGRQIQVTLPSSQSLLQILVGSGPSVLSSSQYTISGSTISIPDSTIGTYGSIYTIVTTSSGAYAFALSGSQTNDNWFDAGSSASLSAGATGAMSFTSWSGSPTIANPTSPQTTVAMNSYYSLTVAFSIGP